VNRGNLVNGGMEGSLCHGAPFPLTSYLPRSPRFGSALIMQAFLLTEMCEQKKEEDSDDGDGDGDGDGDASTVAGKDRPHFVYAATPRRRGPLHPLWFMTATATRTICGSGPCGPCRRVRCPRPIWHSTWRR